MTTQTDEVATEKRALLEAIQTALWRDEVTRRSEFENVQPTLGADGVVVLSGHVSDEPHAQRLLNDIHSVPGVRKVIDNLIRDDTLERAVSYALANHPEIAHDLLQVVVRHGVVYLSGEVADSATAELAVRTAAHTPGVRMVAPDLRIDGQPVTNLPQLVQPQIGARVYTTSDEIGKVSQVIINPDHGRVEALVVSGQIPPGPDTNSLQSLPQRTWVIPVGIIDEWQPYDVHLGINNEALQKLPILDETSYRVPSSEWRPPFPYTLQDILWTD